MPQGIRWLGRHARVDPKMIDGLLAALGLLTRIPVPARVWDAPSVRARSLAWYPLVGLLVGGLLALAGWVLQGAPELLGAALLLVAWGWLSGGLHLDGLADMADAWVGGMGDRERSLQIMKDPRSGPVAVVVLVLLLLVKFAALASLYEGVPAREMMVSLVVAPLLARSLLPLAFLTTPYVRAGGIGAGLTGARRWPCVLNMLLAAVLAVMLGGRAGGVALVVAVVVFLLWRRACMQRLQGMTGDTCGALVELTEAAALAAMMLAHT